VLDVLLDNKVLYCEYTDAYSNAAPLLPEAIDAITFPLDV